VVAVPLAREQGLTDSPHPRVLIKAFVSIHAVTLMR
jgi:hypothetical protein